MQTPSDKGERSRKEEQRRLDALALRQARADLEVLLDRYGGRGDIRRVLKQAHYATGYSAELLEKEEG